MCWWVFAAGNVYHPHSATHTYTNQNKKWGCNCCRQCWVLRVWALLGQGSDGITRGRDWDADVQYRLWKLAMFCSGMRTWGVWSVWRQGEKGHIVLSRVDEIKWLRRKKERKNRLIKMEENGTRKKDKKWEIVWMKKERTYEWGYKENVLNLRKNENWED